VVVPLALAQDIVGKPGAVRVSTSVPSPNLRMRSPVAIPRAFRGAMYDRWYCSPYPQSIAYQLQEAIPHSHRTDSAGGAERRCNSHRSEGLIFLITLAALLASALAVPRPWHDMF